MSYTVNGKTYETYSAVNQRIIDRLVSREVYCCITEEVEYMLRRIPYNDNGNPLDESVYDALYVYGDDGVVESAEIYEWWAVTDWLGEKLRDKGQPVIDTVWGKSYWGRTCTGQAISLDWCIAEIAKDMGILDGMEWSWANDIS